MSPKSPLIQPTYDAAMMQSQSFRALSNFMNDELSKFDLSLSEWKLLGHLNEADELTPSQIANHLSVKLPITSRLLRSLEDKGFVERVQNSTDNRVFHACITKAGNNIVLRVEKELRISMKQFLSDINPSDLKTYLLVLGKIAAKVKK